MYRRVKLISGGRARGVALIGDHGPHEPALYRSGERPTSVAFFDLDRTILSINSGSAWVRSERRGGHISAAQLIKAMWWISRYKLGWSALEDPLLQAIQALAGTEEREMEARVAQFFEEVVCAVRPRALEAIKRHQARGEPCVLITTSSIYLAQRFAAHLGLDEALATRFEVERGRFTGRPGGVLCYGEGKVTLASAYANAHNISLKGCSFYSDSYSDLPLLEAVGAPYVVTPDRKLRRAADTRGWPILTW